MVRLPRCSPLFPYTTLFRSRGGPPHPSGRGAGPQPSGVSVAHHLARAGGAVCAGGLAAPGPAAAAVTRADRKSTRLNSSHVKISYAVFCLKKKIKEGNSKQQ